MLSVSIKFIFVGHIYSITYETWLGLLSIDRFLSSRESAEPNRFLTQRSLTVFYLLFIFVTAKELGFYLWISIVSEDSDKNKLLQVIFYYYTSYIFLQIILFIGMIFQFLMKSESQDQLTRQTKIIGATKLVIAWIVFECSKDFFFAGLVCSIPLGYCDRIRLCNIKIISSEQSSETLIFRLVQSSHLSTSFWSRRSLC